MNAPGDLPAVAAIDAFGGELVRLDAAIEREILRLRARYELSTDEQRGLYISDEQVEALLRHVPTYRAEPLQAPPPEPGSRWQHLQNALALSRAELDLVLLALAPELDAKYETLFAYLNNDVSRKAPTLELALRLFGVDGAARRVLREALLPSGALCRYGAIEVAAARDAPRSLRGLRLPAALVDWLHGVAFDDERLATVVHTTRVSGAMHAPALARLAAPLGGAGGSVLLFSAPQAAEAAWSARQALAALSTQSTVLALDLIALRSTTAVNDVVSALLLQQALLGAGIVAAPLDALFDVDGRAFEAPCAALRRIAQTARPLALATSQSVRWRELLGDVHVFAVPVAELDAASRTVVWQREVAAIATAGPVADAVRGLADRFTLSEERIVAAARHAVELARAANQPLDASHLYAAARAASADGSAGVTRVVPARFAWDELVVPADVRQRLLDIVRAVDLRPQVFDRWGFEHRAGGARGIKVMFAGASGTGKTMAAAIVARALGLDLHKIELSAVMSKYIGETEKNLDRAFASARRCNAVLFIDEADALLGKRSEVKDAHDRYANVEIAHLLQKMEDHDGVVIVATNLAHNIDAAFSRRMQFVVQFPMPDAAARELLWRSLFPSPDLLAGDVELAFLSRQFTLAGGDIRNIVLDAAFRAAHAGGKIGMAHLMAAIAQHYVKRGKVLPTTEFGEFAHLLGAAQLDAPAAREA